MGRRIANATSATLFAVAAALLVAAARTDATATVEGWLTERLTDAGLLAPLSARLLDGPARRWNTCTVDVAAPPEAPPGFDADLSWALAQIDAAAAPDFQAGAGAGHITVTFTDSSPDLAERGAWGLWQPDTDTAGNYAGGTITLARTAYETLPASGNGSRRTLLLHELAHAAGVGHSADPDSLVSPKLSSASRLTADVAAALSTQTCG